MIIAALILLACALVSGAGLLLGFLPTSSLVPAVFLGAAMILALLKVVAQSDTAR